jgi:hypothetical protein
MRRNGRVRVSLLVLVVVVALVSSACLLPGDGNVSDPCKCPNLEAVAPTIDWLGTQQEPDSVNSNFGFELTHSVQLCYLVPNGLEAAELTIQRLIDAGFDRAERPSGNVGIFRGDDWQVGINGGQDGPDDAAGDVLVEVEITNDERAQEMLQPFIDAFGTVP